MGLPRIRCLAAQCVASAIISLFLLFGLGPAIADAGALTTGVTTPCVPTSTVASAATELTFSIVGSCDWTPAAGITTITVTLWGAMGAAGSDAGGVHGTPGRGGEGDRVTGVISGIAGKEIQITVGGAAAGAASPAHSGAGGLNGGGLGTPDGGGGGGGASDLRVGSMLLTDRVLVAGGGGGGGSPGNTDAGGNGGNAGSTGSSGAGLALGRGAGSLGGGGGGGVGEGGFNNGGSAGHAPTQDKKCEPTSSAGPRGSQGQGAIGATGVNFGSGGGGGGYFGGGGGGGGAYQRSCHIISAGGGGGGGGSSFTEGADGIVPAFTSWNVAEAPDGPNGEIQIDYTDTAPTTTLPPAVSNTGSTPVAASTPPADAPLASTGIAVGRLLFAGVLLLVLGAIFVKLSRRRPPAHARRTSLVATIFLAGIPRGIPV